MPSSRPSRHVFALAAALVLTGALPLAAARPAAASPARAPALLAGDYLEDDAALFRWPGSARDHAGVWWLDSGRVDPRHGWRTGSCGLPGAGLERGGPGAGVSWRPGDGAWTAAVSACARAADGDHAGLHRDGPGAAFAGLLGRRVGRVDVAATWRHVDGRLATADVPLPGGASTTSFAHGRDDLGAGARLDLSPTSYLDLAGDLRHERNRLTAAGGADPAPDWSGDTFVSWRTWSARARVFAAVGARTVLTPAVEVLREDFAGPALGTRFTPDAVWAHRNRLLRLGLAVTWLPDPDRMLALTAEHVALWARHEPVAATGTVAAGEERWRAFCLRAAFVQRVCWWLSLRAAAGFTHRADGQADTGEVAGGLGLHLGPWGADLTAGSAPLPEPWLSLAADRGPDPWLRAALHREF